MKTLINLCNALALSFLLSCGSSQNSNINANATASFKIWGNCEMCKETIEGSLKVDGIKSADWNTETKMMTVSFDSTKISRDQVEKNIASVGYDTEKYRGRDQAYTNLPECCQYERKP